MGTLQDVGFFVFAVIVFAYVLRQLATLGQHFPETAKTQRQQGLRIFLLRMVRHMLLRRPREDLIPR